MAPLDPLLSSDMPSEQAIANAAIIAVFAYLVPLLTMEINFFRLAVYRSRRRWLRREEKLKAVAVDVDVDYGVAAAAADDAGCGADGVANEHGEGSASSPNDESIVNADKGAAGGDDCSSASSAVGHLVNEVAHALHDTVQLRSPTANAKRRCNDDPALQKAYRSIRHASMQAIFSSLLVCSLTAVGTALNTRGLDRKVIAIIVGASQFMAALMAFIVSAKIPQWIGVYHEGAIRLVRCSSSYSERFQDVDLNDDDTLRKLRVSVRRGCWFHFGKFFIVLMPFYCGVQEATIPLSILTGTVFGFILMWAVFVVHEKYIHRRNIVSFTTILLLSIISSLAFTKGMAWIQTVWNLEMLRDEDVLLTISFFSWLGLLAVVHSLFIWHTLRTEKTSAKEEKTEHLEDEEGNGAADLGNSRHSQKSGTQMRRNSHSYSSFTFDPRVHFTDGKCQFMDHPDLQEDITMESSDVAPSDQPPLTIDCDGKDEGEEDFYTETPVVAASNEVAAELDDEEANDVNQIGDDESDDADQQQMTPKKRRCPSWCDVLICYSSAYQQSSCMWKALVWLKIIVMTLTYCLCLYFVAVCIGATYQINTTKAALPAVHKALYDGMNEGEVCAFDNRGPESNITTFENKEAAHEAGFLVVHCGACGACSKWENLIIQWTTRSTMAALANQCAKEALFGGGDDVITECLMREGSIGFEYECALCWQEDILCTKDNCAFIFLQSQMTNNVGNFAVGPDEVTSATCEEAHCEVGQFVPCSGATRRRMNIVSSIGRPKDQQCNIVDVEDWDDLFFGSGVA